MTTEITDYARTRYTAKTYDPARKVTAPQIDQLRELLRLSPSSVNSQPWHFVVASTSEGKARIAKAALPSNVNKVVDASHVFVLCTRHTLTDEYIDELIEQEARDGRFPTPEDRQARKQALMGYANKHRHVARDTHAWMEKQTYIALGFLLMGARQLGLDATPMEGFDTIALDRDLGLPERGFVSSVIVSVGHHGADDFNVKLPKSRFAADVLFTDI